MIHALLSRRTNRSARWSASLLTGLVVILAAPGQTATAAETVWLRTTNYLPHFITNVIKVSIPTNTFVDEYQTNWVRQRITNVVEVYRTNRLTEFRTNVVPVDEYRTNVQVAYATNLKTLTLTNWETVLVMKTNWVNVPLTNVVEIEVPAAAPSAPVARAAATPATAPPEPVSTPVVTAPVSAADANGRMEFELTHSGQPLKGGQHPVRLVLRPADGGGEILPVQEWRVEKVDGGAFMVGSRAEFTGTLPAGNYHVTVRLRGADNQLRNLRSQLAVLTDRSPQRSAARPVER